MADTHRVNAQGRTIDALFIKIEGHPREELEPGVVDFQVDIYKTAVKIDYLLSSIDDSVKIKNPYWFHGEFVMPENLALYQPGEIYVALRQSLAE